MIRPHGEHGESEAESEQGEEDGVQVVEVEGGRRVVLQKR